MRKIIYFFIIVAVVVMAAAIYFTYDPAKPGNIFPRCFFLTFTGYKCPGCGSQRAIHSLLHGDFLQAFRFNAALVVALPILVVFAISEWKRNSWPRFYEIVNNKWIGITILFAVVFWWIIRNVFNF
ncbi:MAG: DUF2752 domain-containing protein [Muribaculaceae bacterium]|nr:DUF2752 domain-containing protein [Muribaculaceae bacterium]